MRTLKLTLLFLAFSLVSMAQYAPEINANNIRLPRFENQAEIENKVQPAEGMLVYNKETKSNWVFDGVKWRNTVIENTNMGFPRMSNDEIYQNQGWNEGDWVYDTTFKALRIRVNERWFSMNSEDSISLGTIFFDGNVSISAIKGHYFSNTFTVAGTFRDSLTLDGHKIYADGGTDIFLANYNNHGKLLWLRRAGGTGFDYASKVEYDAAGNILVIGNFESTCNFNTPSSNASAISSFGQKDAFIAKFSIHGDLLWVRRGGGSLNDESVDLSISYTGEIFVTGNFRGTAVFSHTNSNVLLNSKGESDIFLIKYSSSGAILWARTAGGVEDDMVTSISRFDHIYGFHIAGRFKGTCEFTSPTSPLSSTLTSAGGFDNFVCKYTSEGELGGFLKRVGGSNDEFDAIVEFTNSGIILGGTFSGTIDFNTPTSTGSNTIVSAGSVDIFLQFYSSNGTPGTRYRIGGVYADLMKDINANGFDTYVTGNFNEKINFNNPSSYESNILISEGSNDFFVAKFNQQQKLINQKSFGGDFDDQVNNIDNLGDLSLVSGVWGGNALLKPSLNLRAGRFIWLTKF